MVGNVMYAGISKRTFLGLIVLGIGVMLLLDTTNALGGDTAIFGTYWPVLLIALGSWRLAAHPMRPTLLPLVILTIGILFLLAELDVGSWGIGRLWPVIVVVLGLSLLLRGGLSRRGWGPYGFGTAWKRGRPGAPE